MEGSRHPLNCNIPDVLKWWFIGATENSTHAGPFHHCAQTSSFPPAYCIGTPRKKVGKLSGKGKLMNDRGDVMHMNLVQKTLRKQAQKERPGDPSLREVFMCSFQVWSVLAQWP